MPIQHFRILVINPGSTSTKIAVYENEQEIFVDTIRHQVDELEQFVQVADQFSFRKEAIFSALDKAVVSLNSIQAIAARGGLIEPIESGTYFVNELMLQDLKAGEHGQHAANLGALIAHEIASVYQIPAYVVDPVVVDEMQEIARISGSSLFKRASVFHALNQKAVAREYAEDIGKQYHDLQLIVAHLGGGVSVGVHQNGKVIDVNNGLIGEGPFSPERAGTVPVGDLIELCFSGKLTKDEIKRQLVGEGGFVSYLGTSDCLLVEQMIFDGNQQAKLIFDAMAYQVAKEIGAASTVLFGKVDAIILTGGLAHSTMLVDEISSRIKHLGHIEQKPGENEMLALAKGALRVLQGREIVNEYQPTFMNKEVEQL